MLCHKFNRDPGAVGSCHEINDDFKKGRFLPLEKELPYQQPDGEKAAVKELAGDDQDSPSNQVFPTCVICQIRIFVPDEGK